MNRILILAIIMTTFFMDGCVSNNSEAIKYFDSVYLPIQEVVELDNVFQENLHSQLIGIDDFNEGEDTDSLSEEDYQKSVQEIDASLKSLTDALSLQIEHLKENPIYNNETGLQRAGLTLLNTYSNVVNSDFVEMIQIIKEDSITERDNKRFNDLLKQSTAKLNIALETFYDQAMEYGDRYEIDLEFENE